MSLFLHLACSIGFWPGLCSHFWGTSHPLISNSSSQACIVTILLFWTHIHPIMVNIIWAQSVQTLKMVFTNVFFFVHAIKFKHKYFTIALVNIKFLQSNVPWYAKTKRKHGFTKVNIKRTQMSKYLTGLKFFLLFWQILKIWSFHPGCSRTV